MKRPNPAHVSAIRDFIARSPFPTLLSMRPTELAVGRATLEIEIAEKHRQLLGVVHGGVIASLIDTATFWSVYYAIDDPDAWLTTVDLKLNFLAPARQGRLIARGRQKKVGGTLCYATASVTDDADTLLAHGAATLMVLKNARPSVDVQFPEKFLDD